MPARQFQSLSLKARTSAAGHDRRKQMTRLKILGAAAVVSALIAAPASAQLAQQEPGLWAFYHPNGDSNSASARPAEAQAMAPRLIMRHPVPARQAKSVK